MKNRITAEELNQRNQGYSSNPITPAEMPFKLSRLPTRRKELCSIGYEGMGYYVDVALYLAPPLKQRPWWSVWASATESSLDCGTHRYASTPVGYINAEDDDIETDLAIYLLMKVVSECCMAGEEIHEGMLAEPQIKAALLSAAAWCCKPDPNSRQHGQIVQSALPDLQSVVAEQLQSTK